VPESKRQYVFAEGQRSYHHLGEGKWFSYNMEEGQTVKLQAEWDMMTGDMVNEYSVVAWAENEAVEITHGAGEESDSYPHQESLHSNNKSAEDDTAQHEAAKKAEEEAALKAKDEAEKKSAAEKAAQEEEAARKAKEEAEEAARQAKEEADRKAKEEAARKAKAEEEAARKAKEEADRKAKEAAEAAAKAKEEAEKLKQKEEADNEKADNVNDDFDRFVAEIPIRSNFRDCRHFQSTTEFLADGSEVKQFGHLCDSRDMLLQVTLSTECY
jgi:hypothetical protein